MNHKLRLRSKAVLTVVQDAVVRENDDTRASAQAVEILFDRTRPRRGAMPFCSVRCGGRIYSISAAAVVCLIALTGHGEWVTTQELKQLLPPQFGQVNGHLGLLCSVRLVDKKPRVPGIKRYLWCATEVGRGLARSHGDAALAWLSRHPAS